MNTRRLVTLSLTVLLTLGLSGSALAAGSGPRHDFTEAPQSPAQTEYVTVLFEDPPAAQYAGGVGDLKATRPEPGQKLNPNNADVLAYVDYLRSARQDFKDHLARNAPRAEVVREWSLISNGLAVKLNGERLQTVQNGPGVRTAVYSALYQPTMNVSLELIGADELWKDVKGGRGNAGAGVKVGVIDTGIREDHRFFGCKDPIVHKVYFSGEGLQDPDQTLFFDHGTHVSGTIAGCVINLGGDEVISGKISGVAPAAELWDYNVFPGFGAGFVAFGGSAFSHDIIEAVEDTIEDGMDVINMSLGGGVQGPHDTLAEAVDAAVDAGLVAAVAAGNSGPGDGTVESPGSAANALTAGAGTNPHFIGITVTVTEPDLGTFGAALGDFKNFDPAITADYTVTDPTNGCSAISADLTGQIALIDRGVCTFTTKIRNAQTAGAVGVLVANNVAGDPVAMGHDGTEPFPTIPAAMVSKDDGAAIKPAGTATVDGTEVQEFLTDNADIIAGFSSRGPTPFTFLIKPDAAAPGVNVYSSVFDDGFAMFQGTSMATPHLAGSAAVLIQLNPDWTQFDVKSAIVNTAARVVTDHVTGAQDAGVLARGGGRVDLSVANDAVLSFDPVSASFGLWQGNVDVSAALDLTLRNISGKNASCSVEVAGPDIVTTTTSSVQLGAGETTTLTLNLDAGRSGQTPSDDYDGDVVVDCGGKAATLRAPWWVRIDRGALP